MSPAGAIRRGFFFGRKHSLQNAEYRRYCRSMDFSIIAASIGKQFVTVWNAPVPFLAVVLLSIWAVWKVVHREFTNRLADAASRLDLSQSRVQEYERKLAGATPEEAQNRMEKLEAELAALKPRTLSEESKEKMATALRGTVGVLVLELDSATSDSRKFGAAIGAVFESVGWQVQYPMVLGMHSSPPTGLRLLVRDKSVMTQEEAGVQRALLLSGLSFDVVSHDHPRMADETHIQISAPH